MRLGMIPGAKRPRDDGELAQHGDVKLIEGNYSLNIVAGSELVGAYTKMNAQQQAQNAVSELMQNIMDWMFRFGRKNAPDEYTDQFLRNFESDFQIVNMPAGDGFTIKQSFRIDPLLWVKYVPGKGLCIIQNNVNMLDALDTFTISKTSKRADPVTEADPTRIINAGGFGLGLKQLAAFVAGQPNWKMSVAGTIEGNDGVINTLVFFTAQDTGLVCIHGSTSPITTSMTRLVNSIMEGTIDDIPANFLMHTLELPPLAAGDLTAEDDDAKRYMQLVRASHVSLMHTERDLCFKTGKFAVFSGKTCNGRIFVNGINSGESTDPSASIKPDILVVGNMIDYVSNERGGMSYDRYATLVHDLINAVIGIADENELFDNIVADTPWGSFLRGIEVQAAKAGLKEKVKNSAKMHQFIEAEIQQGLYITTNTDEMLTGWRSMGWAVDTLRFRNWETHDSFFLDWITDTVEDDKNHELYSGCPELFANSYTLQQSVELQTMNDPTKVFNFNASTAPGIMAACINVLDAAQHTRAPHARTTTYSIHQWVGITSPIDGTIPFSTVERGEITHLVFFEPPRTKLLKQRLAYLCHDMQYTAEHLVAAIRSVIRNRIANPGSPPPTAQEIHAEATRAYVEENDF